MTTSALAGPGKRPWQNRQSCQPIEQVLGHPLFIFVYRRMRFLILGKQIPTAKPKLFCFCCEVFGFAVRFLVLPWGFWFCRDVFVFAVRFSVLPWQLWATIALCPEGYSAFQVIYQTWDAVSNVWYFFSNKIIFEGEIKDAKMSGFSSDIQTLIQH